MAPLHVALPMIGLASLVTAYSGDDASAVVGSKAPYGIPSTSFQQALSQTNATAQFTVPGFNLSSPGAMKKTNEWTVHVSVSGDVPLKKASSADVDKGKYTQVTTMSMDAPDPGIILNKAKGNTLCAGIGFGLKDKATRENQDDAKDEDGECAFMSKECKADLEEAASDAGGSCGKISIPSSCDDWISSSVTMESFELTPKILGANRFFSFGSEPAKANDDKAYDIAVTNIWPVLFSWHSGKTSSASLRCLRAEGVSSSSREPDSVPDQGNDDDDDSDDSEGAGGSSNSDDTSGDDMGNDKDGAGVKTASGMAVGLVAVGVTCLFALF